MAYMRITFSTSGRWLRLLSPASLVIVLGLGLSAMEAPGQDPGASHCGAALGQAVTQQGQELSDYLDVLSWNIQKASNAGWATDLAALASDVNLAFIQEAAVEAKIPGAIPTPLYQAFAAGYTNDRQRTGVMTLSSTSPSLHCNLTHWEPWLGTPKATSITEFPLAGRQERLLAINLHAVNFALGLAGYEQQLRSLAELLASHQGPAILAGDFNTWSAARQELVDRILGEHGMQAVQFQPDLRTTAFGRALDHIYVRGLQASFSEVIPVNSSDHNPLRARLRLQ
jgi:endonuclease/exonuclease/phosphatase (EEP) superfamily protein YafD